MRIADRHEDAQAPAAHERAGRPDVSVVIPAYNSAPFLAERMAALAAFLDSPDGPGSWELVVVDDGSNDGTADVVRGLHLSHLVPVFRPANGGKFAALASGMAAARGRCRVFTDADLPYEPASITRMAHLVLHRGFHMVVGDRTLPGSAYAGELGLVRRLATRGFSAFVRLFVTAGLYDTQCGLKAFRGDVADALFPLLREHGFAGDVEMLYVALLHNLEIKRVPVRLRYQGRSTVKPMLHAFAMLESLARIRWRRGRGLYDSPTLAALSQS
ncbi:MAG: glycosyltransferase [Deltaproteobacteria bacterium]|nr:glycosyltransferase [Deltaproteobacteria bacterium]